MSYLTSFAKFIETDAGRKACDQEFLDRLARSGAKIDSLNALLRFAKERWAEDNPLDYRKSDPKALHGREAMKAVWSAYLAWAEAGPERKAGPAPKAVAG